MNRKCYFFIFILFLVGCKDKTLTCINNNNSEDIIIDEKITVSFNMNRINYFHLDKKVSMSDVKYRDSLKSDINDNFLYYQNNKEIIYNISDDVDGFSINLEINFDKLNDNFKKNIRIINYESSYEQLKDEYESNGYVCR